MEDLKQKTGKEALANFAIYLGADPKDIGGSTQSVLKYFRDNIDRLGTTNEDLRDEKIGSLIKQSYSNIAPDSLKRITENLPTSSFKSYLEKNSGEVKVDPKYDSLVISAMKKFPGKSKSEVVGALKSKGLIK